MGTLGIGLWLAGPIIWATHFIIVYASESVACTRLDADSHSLIAGIATIIALASIAFIAVRSRAGRFRDTAFLRTTALTMNLLAFLAVTWAGIAAVLLPSCTGVG
ncbi:hypothetical protein [Flaviflagellibacter deserti]|uniref:Transmembrane protein n=1 Tax=Flaviflagellibacter deserti TaxID=2267266 RepID=A0ABV9YZX6_9HYPH